MTNFNLPGPFGNRGNASPGGNAIGREALGGIIGLLLRNPRLLMALLVAGAGLISFLAKTDKNEITGEYQHVGMTESQEMQLGLQTAPQMAREMGGALDPQRDRAAAYVAQMGQKLVVNSRAKDSVYAKQNNFHFYLLNDPQTVNAFALPGGQVFITLALYNRLENDAQLAGVLGHEIGHVIHRHSAEHMAKAQLGQSVAGAVATGAGSMSVGQAAAAAVQMINLKYGRSDELQSDEWGLVTMQACGYDPSQMVRVMEILKEATGGKGRGPSMFATHPDPDARIARIKDYLEQNFPNGVPLNLGKGNALPPH